jgi:hypothetical protein
MSYVELPAGDEQAALAPGKKATTSEEGQRILCMLLCGAGSRRSRVMLLHQFHALFRHPLIVTTPSLCMSRYSCCCWPVALAGPQPALRASTGAITLGVVHPHALHGHSDITVIEGLKKASRYACQRAAARGRDGHQRLASPSPAETATCAGRCNDRTIS